MNGKRFKQIREDLGLSQDQLAQMLGFSSKQAVSNIETGFRNPSNLVTAVMLILKELPKKRSLELQTLLFEFCKQEESKNG